MRANPAAGQSEAVAYLAMGAGASMLAYHVASKAVRDALFLSSFDIGQLPTMVIAAAAVSILAVGATSRAMSRFTPARLVPVSFALSALLLLMVWSLVASLPRLSAVLIYLHIVAFGSLLTSGFWSVMAELFDPTTAKKQIGRIAGCGTLGGIAGGLVSERVAVWFGAPAMLPVLALFHAVCALLLHRLSRCKATAPSVQASSAPAPPEASIFEVLRGASYLRTVAALVLLGTASAAMVDFVFKAQATALIGKGENLLRFFALFYSGVGVLTFVVQTFFSNLSLARLGLAKTVGTLPCAVLFGGLGALTMPGLASAGIARALEAIFRGSLFRAGYELFYMPIPAREKRAAKSIVDVGFDRLGDAVGSGLVHLLLLLGPLLATHAILTAAILISLAGLWIASRLHDAYVYALERGLMDRAEKMDDLNGESQAVSRFLRSMTLAYATSSVLASLPRAPRTAPVTRSRTTLITRSADANPSPEAPPPTIPPPSSSILSDPVLRQVADLRSGDPARVLHILASPGELPDCHLPHVIQLLAWDAVAPAAIDWLRRAAARHCGQLVDALLWPETDFAIRRRLPRVLAVCGDQRAADGLMQALRDKRFEVRYQCGRALNSLHSSASPPRIASGAVIDAVLREVAVSRPVWESRRLLDRVDDYDSSSFVDDFLRDRSSRSLEHVFTLLVLVLPKEPLRIAFRGLHTDDEQLRGTALEYLDSALPPAIRERLWPLLEDYRADFRPRQARPARPGDEILSQLLRSDQSIRMNLDEMRRRMEPMTD